MRYVYAREVGLAEWPMGAGTPSTVRPTMSAEDATPEDRENVTIAQHETFDAAFRTLFSGNVDLVAGELRDAYQQSETPSEFADRLRQVEREIGMLADMADSIDEGEQ